MNQPTPAAMRTAGAAFRRTTSNTSPTVPLVPELLVLDVFERLIQVAAGRLDLSIRPFGAFAHLTALPVDLHGLAQGPNPRRQ